MESTTAHNIRRVLASNFETLTSRALHNANFPRQIKVEALERNEIAAITTANFCYQIGVIDAETYCNLRDLVLDVTASVKEFRNIHGGACEAVGAARLAIGEKVAALCAALDLLKCGDASATVNA